jgi:D-3-phosphoglycerate dehydrogenase / 2-oxoglutarate reductase
VPHVVVAGKIHEAGRAILRAAPGLTVDFVDDGADAAFRPFMPTADALLVRTQRVGADVIASAPRLKIVSRHGVGYDAVDVGALDARGIPLTIVGDVNSRTVAEHTLMMMLTLAKRTVAYDRATREGVWNIRNTFAPMELWGKTLLVIGFGRIGRLVAKLAAPFDMTILANDAVLDDAAIRAAGAEPARDLDAALGRADFVTLHIPSAGGAVIGPDRLKRVKRGAFVINTARGGLVDEAALAAALERGDLGGAGLDVFMAEPPPAELSLLKAPNTILSPHSAGLTEECAARMGAKSAENIVDFFAGRLDPALVVNPAGKALRPKGASN